MGYSKHIYEKAESIMSLRRQNAVQQADKKREEIYSKLPRVREIERELAQTGYRAAKAVVKGEDTREQLLKLRDANLRLQGELQVLLVKNGYTTADLDEKYKCSICSDKGYLDGRMCSCMKLLLRDIAFSELNELSPLTPSSFSTFSLDYYSDEPDENGNVPRKRMEKILNFCKDYAKDFTPQSKSIYMEGATGLGKTHLSLAIAGAVIEKGYGVIYCSLPDIVLKIEREHFSGDYNTGTLSHLESCDLLILDDLGTEYPTSFNKSCVYNLINKRLLLQKPTIINTNLTGKEIKSLYTDRLISRMLGEQVYIKFIGKDIRLKKGRTLSADVTHS